MEAVYRIGANLVAQVWKGAQKTQNKKPEDMEVTSSSSIAPAKERKGLESRLQEILENLLGARVQNRTVEEWKKCISVAELLTGRLRTLHHIEDPFRAQNDISPDLDQKIQQVRKRKKIEEQEDENENELLTFLKSRKKRRKDEKKEEEKTQDDATAQLCSLSSMVSLIPPIMPEPTRIGIVGGSIVNASEEELVDSNSSVSSADSRDSAASPVTTSTTSSPQAKEEGEEGQAASGEKKNRKKRRRPKNAEKGDTDTPPHHRRPNLPGPKEKEINNTFARRERRRRQSK